MGQLALGKLSHRIPVILGISAIGIAIGTKETRVEFITYALGSQKSH
jgi:hypothetical protein